MAIKKLRTTGAVLGTAAAAVYTAPTSTDAIVTTLRLVHVGTTAATYEVAVAGQTIAKGTTLQPGATDVHVELGPLFLQPGETISGLASLASTIRLVASLVERDAL
jgi:hypothetical protein